MWLERLCYAVLSSDGKGPLARRFASDCESECSRQSRLPEAEESQGTVSTQFAETHGV